MSGSSFDKLIVIVHGVGDPQPGETLDCFARSIASREAPLREAQSTIWLREKGSRTDHVTTFATPVRTLESDQQKRLQMAEVFWGDLSRVRRGLIGVLHGLFQIIFGLRYVAYVAADQPGRAIFHLKQLGLISSRILQGPVLAVCFFLALLTGCIYITEIMWAESYKAYWWTQLMVAACCIIALAISSLGGAITRSRVIERFWFWVNVTAMFIAGLMVVKTAWLDQWFPETAVYHTPHPGLIWYSRILVVLLGLLWFIEMSVLICMAVCWLVALAHPRVHRSGLHVAFLVPALSLGIWSQALPMIWLTSRESLQQFIRTPEYAAIFKEVIPLLGVQLMMTILIVIATAVVLVRYFRWRLRFAPDMLPMEPPRLIVHPILQSTLGTCMCVGIGLTFTLGSLQAIGHSYDETWAGQILAEMNKYAVVILVPVGGLFILLMPHLRPAFDIILDVVNHFYFRSTMMDDVLDDDDEFDVSETTFEKGRLYFSRRDAIHFRMKRILQHFRDSTDGQQELVIVSHSQGTMIAIEVLNDPELAWLQNCFSHISLITMGSPLTHLYQHYFKHLYPPLTNPHWKQLCDQLNRWDNIYRADDFVGTRIDFPNWKSIIRPVTFDAASSEPPECTNHCVGLRGHQDYWSDLEVLELLREIILDDDLEMDRRAAA